MKKKSLLIEICALLIVIVFFYTGFMKLYEFPYTRMQMKESPWSLIANNSYIISWTLPLVEIAVCIMLLWVPLRRIGFMLAFALFTGFTLYIAILMISGVRLPCSCGGIMSSLSWTQHLFINIGYIAISLLGLFLDKRTANVHRNTVKEGARVQVI